jgi:hypothetical protein
MVGHEYPFIHFMSVCVFPCIYWLGTIEISLLGSNDTQFQSNFGQVCGLVSLSIGCQSETYTSGPRLIRRSTPAHLRPRINSPFRTVVLGPLLGPTHHIPPPAREVAAAERPSARSQPRGHGTYRNHGIRHDKMERRCVFESRRLREGTSLGRRIQVCLG